MENRFLEWSPWAPAPTDIQPPLQDEVTADVAIIGGGFTGLSAAIELRDAGVDVAVLELDFCGKGASGRNAGHLTPTIGKDFPTMVKSFGEDRALAYAKFAERSVIYTESVFDRLGIECDYKAAGNIVTGVHKQHRDALLRAADVSSRLGIGVEFLDGDEMRRRQLPPFGLFGVLEHHGGHLNPGKYIAGLRRAALEKGVRIFEGTRVMSYNDRSRSVEVVTESGKMAIGLGDLAVTHERNRPDGVLNLEHGVKLARRIGDVGKVERRLDASDVALPDLTVMPDLHLPDMHAAVPAGEQLERTRVRVEIVSAGGAVARDELEPAGKGRRLHRIVHAALEPLQVPLRERDEGRVLGRKEVIGGRRRSVRFLGDLVDADIVGMPRREQPFERIEQFAVALKAFLAAWWTRVDDRFASGASFSATRLAIGPSSLLRSMSFPPRGTPSSRR